MHVKNLDLILITSTQWFESKRAKKQKTKKGQKLTMQKKACVDSTAFIQSVIWQGCMRHCTLTGHSTNVNATNQVKLISR